MSRAACPGPDALLLLRHELLEEPQAAALAEHLAGCARCQADGVELLALFEAPPVPEAPEGVLEALVAAIAEEQAQEGVPALKVHLRCTYCHDDLLQREAVYCAACLAPQHEACFLEHGRCAIAGCECDAWVRRSEAPVAAPLVAAPLVAELPAKPSADAAALSPSQRRNAWAIGASLLFGIGLAAALNQTLDERPPARPQRRPELTAARGPALERVASSYQVADVVYQRPDTSVPAWVTALEARLRERTLKHLNLRDTPLGDVVNLLGDVAEATVVLGPEVDGAQKTDLVLHAATALDALHVLAARHGLALRFESESVVLRPAGRAELPPAPEPGRLDEEGLRLAVRALAPADSWRGGEPLQVHEGWLFVSHTPAVQERVAALLADLRSGKGPAPLEPWYAPTLYTVAGPADARRAARLARLERETVTLDHRGRPFLQAIEELWKSFPIITSDAARALVTAEDVKVSLRLRDISLRNALNLILAAHERLTWRLDREGRVVVHVAGEPDPDLALLVAADSALERRPGSGEPEGWRAALTAPLSGDRLVGTRREALAAVVSQLASRPAPVDLLLPTELRDGEERVAVEPRGRPCQEVLDELLRPANLGLRRACGALWVVPRDQATDTPIRRAEQEELLTRPLMSAFAVGGSLGTFAAHLEAALRIPVILTRSARESRARLALPGAPNVREALALAAEQAGVTWAFELHAGQLVLALGAGDAPLVRAHEATFPRLDTGPSARALGLVVAREDRAHDLEAALAALVPSDAAALRGGMQAVREALRRVEELDEALDLLAPGRGPELERRVAELCAWQLERAPQGNLVVADRSGLTQAWTRVALRERLFGALEGGREEQLLADFPAWSERERAAARAALQRATAWVARLGLARDEATYRFSNSRSLLTWEDELLELDGAAPGAPVELLRRLSVLDPKRPVRVKTRRTAQEPMTLTLEGPEGDRSKDAAQLYAAAVDIVRNHRAAEYERASDLLRRIPPDAACARDARTYLRWIEADLAVRRATKLYERGEGEEALEALDQVIATGGLDDAGLVSVKQRRTQWSRVVVAFNRAQALKAEGELKQALAAFKEVSELEHDPSNAYPIRARQESKTIETIIVSVYPRKGELAKRALLEQNWNELHLWLLELLKDKGHDHTAEIQRLREGVAEANRKERLFAEAQRQFDANSEDDLPSMAEVLRVLASWLPDDDPDKARAKALLAQLLPRLRALIKEAQRD